VKVISCTIILWFWASCAWSKPEVIPPTGVAYSANGHLVVLTASGAVARVVNAKVPISSFAIAPDRRSVIYAPAGPQDAGGPLYELSLITGQARMLIRTQIYDKREVYADPDFSPDGSRIVFAIHAQPTGDGVTMAGPFAIFDTERQATRVLRSTMSFGGYGPTYGSGPRWSPGGNRIFLNLVGDFAITNRSGEHLQMPDQWTHVPIENMFAIGWWGNNCIVYKGGDTWAIAETRPAKLLLIKSLRSRRLTTLLHADPADVTHLVAFSPAIWVQKVGRTLVVHSHGRTWSVFTGTRYPYVRIFGGQSEQDVPRECK
jgi:hypothetical protein